ncbi:MAG: glycosyl transferase family 36, partial [Candidatus Omnitrophica bacterium]|nr:glycosyl transferase family 36 [Candidatus Omnitrophota bacterium]
MREKPRVALYKTRYGYFTEDGREFVITRHDTPSPWINVISNGEYGLTFASTGTGYSWLTHARINRLTRCEQDLIKDEWGKFIYIRDNKTASAWSLCYKPTCYWPDFYEVRHGIGYSRVKSKYKEIESTLLIFIPPTEDAEIWQVKIKNLSPYKRSIGVFSYIEWCLGEYPDWHREFHRTFLETFYNKNLQAIFATKRLWQIPGKNDDYMNKEWDYLAFHSLSEEPTSYTSDKESFIGMYRTFLNPKAIENGMCNPREGKWLDAIGSLHINLELEVNEEKTIAFVLGVSKTKSKAQEIIRKYKGQREVEKAFEDLKVFWEDMLDKNSVSTPDKHLDILVNTWLKYQAISCRLWARTAYYQIGGAYGFRDQLQDSQIFLPLKSELTKNQILLHARHQFRDGIVWHWWDPIIERGVKSAHTDDLLWLPFIIMDYIEETNDLNMLNENIPFLDTGEESLFEHAKKAIDLVLSRFSKRGLPLIGEGDWNDGLSNVGPKWKGESVWLGHFLYYIL